MAPYNIPKQPKCFTVAKHFWGLWTNLCKFVLKWDWVRPGSAFVLVCSVFLLLPRPSQIPAPWITNELCTLKVAGHQLERLSKRTGLTVHRNAYNIYPICKSSTPPLSPSWLAQPCSMDPMSTTMVEGSPSHFYFFFLSTSRLLPSLQSSRSPV